MDISQHVVINLNLVAFIVLDYVLLKLINISKVSPKFWENKPRIRIQLSIGYALLFCIVYTEFKLWHGSYLLRGIDILNLSEFSMPCTIAISVLTFAFFFAAFVVNSCRKSIHNYSKFHAHLCLFITLFLIVSGCFLFWAMHQSYGIDVIQVARNYLTDIPGL